MSFNPESFDTVVDRVGTDCAKWDRVPFNRSGARLLPMFVADMDFAAPPAVQDALRRRIDHPVYGYTFESDSYLRAFCRWQQRRNAWDVDEQWLVPTPAVMSAVRASIIAFTDPGDQVVVQTPVYYPFYAAVRDNGREILANPLVCESAGPGDLRYRMDLEGLERSITARTKMVLLCSPHNPVGRVWTRAELDDLAKLCRRHDLLVVSDEIHADLCRSTSRFVPFAAVGPDAAGRTIACHSPSKTFNIAGLASSLTIVPNEQLRRRFHQTLARLGLTISNTLSLAAAQAAYADSGAWADSLTDYLDRQIAWFSDEMGRRFGVGPIAGAPSLRFPPIEGTYLAWLDFGPLLEAAGRDHRDAETVLLEQAALRLSAGSQFGPEAAGFFRMNLAAPRSIVVDGLARLERAVRILESSCDARARRG